MFVLSLGAIGSLVILLAVSVTVGGAEWTQETVSDLLPEESFRERLSRSGLVRAWRCRGVDRPLLAKGESWTFRYSWENGYGPGDVLLTVESDGSAVLESRGHGEAPKYHRTTIASDRLNSMAQAIDRSRLLCQAPIKRADHHIVDLGRFTVQVDGDRYSRTVYAGSCYYLPDLDAFDIVLNEVYALEPDLDRSLTWSPYGISTLSGPCE